MLTMTHFGRRGGLVLATFAGLVVAGEGGAQQPAERQPAPGRPAAEQRAPAKQAPAKQAPPAATQKPPAPQQGIQGWFPMPQGVQPLQAPRMTQPSEPIALTPERVRPPASLLIDCKDAPAGAVTKVPEPLSRWATVYCTKRGHLFSANDQFFALYPGTKIRGALNAAELTGRTGDLGHAAHFTKITQTPLTAAAAKALMVGLTPETAKIVEGKELIRVDLTTDTGKTFSLAAVSPNEDPFWVIPVVDGKLNNRGFYVASLEYVNKNR